MIRDVRTDQVLVVVHSVVSDQGVISAAEQLVAGDAQIRYLRVVPRALPFTMSMFRQPIRAAASGSGLPVRLVTAGDDMATTILDQTRELNIPLLVLGEPSGEKQRAALVHRVLARILPASSAPVLFVPAGAKESPGAIRRILLVLHLPYPAMDLLRLTLPLARRNHAELMILTLPSAAAPLIPDAPSLGTTTPSLVFRPFDAGVWLERECARYGFRARPVSSDGEGAKGILECAAALEADLVVADAGLAELRVGWRRRKLLDLVFPRFPCPLLLGRSA
jgi:hypothetical protein